MGKSTIYVIQHDEYADFDKFAVDRGQLGCGTSCHLASWFPRLGAELNYDLRGQYGCAIEEVFSRLKGVA